MFVLRNFNRKTISTVESIQCCYGRSHDQMSLDRSNHGGMQFFSHLVKKNNHRQKADFWSNSDLNNAGEKRCYNVLTTWPWSFWVGRFSAGDQTQDLTHVHSVLTSSLLSVFVLLGTEIPFWLWKNSRTLSSSHFWRKIYINPQEKKKLSFLMVLCIYGSLFFPS